MEFEKSGTRARVKEPPEVTLVFASEEQSDLIEIVLGILIHATCDADRTEDMR